MLLPAGKGTGGTPVTQSCFKSHLTLAAHPKSWDNTHILPHCLPSLDTANSLGQNSVKGGELREKCEHIW